MFLHTQGCALSLPTDQLPEIDRILWAQEKLGWRFDARWVSRSIFKWSLKTNKSAFGAQSSLPSESWFAAVPGFGPWFVYTVARKKIARRDLSKSNHYMNWIQGCLAQV
jgi:hypothetical protein